MSRRLSAILAAFCLAWTAAGALLLWPDSGDDRDTSGDAIASSAVASADSAETTTEAAGEESLGAREPTTEEPLIPDALEPGPAEPPVGPGEGAYAVEEAEAPLPVRIHLKRPPASGLLFDVDTGEVLWARRPGLSRPIASLTKMMTALIIAEDHRPDEQVLISAKAPHVEGSRIGVLKAGRKVPLRGLFVGLLMASGNDAAVALAEHDAGTVAAFVKRMNLRASELGLSCSRFAGPAGLQDTGNRSCAYDLAALARADLANEWLASVTSRPSASVPFPIKGGRLEVANNHYFAQHGIAGLPGAKVTGLKTGLTNGAGRCYVTTARLGTRHLGVVLLDSPDPITQVPRLLQAGFRS
jgi:D-alanyl-D-alanine carboxypeptidase